MNRRNFIKYIGCGCGGFLLNSCGSAPITERKQLKLIPESKLNPDEFESLTLKKNEFCKIYFNKCLHYNKINDTDNTRVSFDFRVIPYSKYSENHYKLSATGKNKFIPGDYFMYC